MRDISKASRVSPLATFAFGLTLALGAATAPLFAQTGETGATTGEATGGPVAAPELSMGEEVVEDPIYVKEEIEDWKIRCIKTESGNDPCQVFQVLTDTEGNDVAEVALITVDDGSEAVAGATVTTPLGTLLSEQLLIAVDGANAKRYPFTWCDPSGCFARLGYTADGLAALKRGATADVVLFSVARPKDAIVLKMSLKGFTAAFDKMKVINDEVAKATAAAAPAPETPPADGAPAEEKPAEGTGN